ncbi:MAG: hypothetical protein L0332_18775 [Chloroflexi bacterium]|nr:hypothetical protein [Chloroflexota bacterium]MCI0647462.1 hypothetical protein [Chloroflexota bacterium]MCI0728742.1 hypothetical protein [Chloroflexota bacterium]
MNGSRIVAGVVAGLLAGLIFGLGMQIMTAPTPDGGQIPMMAMVAMILGSESLAVGWLYHLFNSAVIGAIFGWFPGNRIHNYTTGLGWGALYGFAWWILGGLILMPLLLGMPAFAPLMMAEMQPVALGSLVGHLVYGLVLGIAYVWLHQRAAGRQRMYSQESLGRP